MKSVSEVDLNEVTAQNSLLILVFHSPQCAHCKAILPGLEKLEEKYTEDINLISVDIFESSAVAAKYNVLSVPTLLFLKQGQLKDKIVGNTYEAIIEEKIKKFIG